MSEVRRYGAEMKKSGTSPMYASVSGQWVHWDDHSAIAADLALAVADKEAYGQNAIGLRKQRDEGLVREAELQKEVARMTSAYQVERARRTEDRAQNDAFQQRLAEAEKWVVYRWQAEVANRPLVNVHRRSLDDTWRQLMRHMGLDDRALCGPTHDELLASPGCVDGEKTPAPAVNLPRRKRKTEYSTAEEEAQADAWNAALDAVQELNR